MIEALLFICIFSITLGFMEVGSAIQNKKFINIGFLGLCMWLAMFIWTPFVINFFQKL